MYIFLELIVPDYCLLLNVMVWVKVNYIMGDYLSYYISDFEYERKHEWYLFHIWDLNLKSSY